MIYSKNNDFTSIPNELKTLTQWVCWKLKKGKSGELRRIYVDPKNGRYARVKDERTWGTFDSAVRMFNHNSNISGIAFVFTKKDPFIEINIHDCISGDGTINPSDDSIVASLLDHCRTYAEISPGEHGIHLIGRGSIRDFDFRRNGIRSRNISMFESSHYLAITGNRFNSEAISPIQDTVDDLKKAMARHYIHLSRESMRDSDEAFLEETLFRHPKWGDKIRDLFNGKQPLEGGNYTHKNGTADISTQDFFFCLMCNWADHNDFARTARILQSSKRIRPKFNKVHCRQDDGYTYFETVVQNAEANLSDFPPFVRNAY
ncbi:hypothetical protein [uncultured Dialister sp.]|jgi:primase-polymerase (primpol)-like protein|uniref:hypothetical protein n=1 Tax=uncultured Dialister sp. TaxID=278064 RepID=UPI0025DAEFDA|nr:hypothetical protein [uncultured Dialister sp.]